jgi:hypothetical protein
MKLLKEFDGKKAGDRVTMWADRGTIEEVIDSGFHENGRYAVAYWVKWDDYGLTCVSFDRDGNWIRD